MFVVLFILGLAVYNLVLIVKTPARNERLEKVLNYEV